MVDDEGLVDGFLNHGRHGMYGTWLMGREAWVDGTFYHESARIFTNGGRWNARVDGTI